MNLRDHFDIIHARGPLFTDIELCEATAAGESGVRSLAYRPIVYAVAKKEVVLSFCAMRKVAMCQCFPDHKV